jgi:integrase
MKQTSFPGVYRRGSRFVAVYRRGGRQCKQTAATFAEAREIKLTRDAEARAKRRGPTLHGHALGWLDRYAGSGRDSVREGTRREYRRLLSTFALRYFDHYVRLRDLDPPAFQQFVDWLTNMPGRGGRLSDRSIANALTPLRLALDAAVAEGMLDRNPADSVVLPRRRHGRAWELKERRFLSREQLARLLAEVPAKWRPLFELLVATGLRISEALGLRWSDLVLDSEKPHLRVTRAVVRGVAVAPKSRNGVRVIPLPSDLAGELRSSRPPPAEDDAPVFPGRDGAPADPGSLRRRVLVPAARRADLAGVGFHTLRHTCAALLIESGASPLRLQRWMGHHSAAYTLDAYGHLIDGELGPALDLGEELRTGAVRARSRHKPGAGDISPN